jgi:tetratricopeptide (TPR) repeat protein
MKKIFFVAAVCAFAAACFAAVPAKPGPENEGDRAFSMRNSITDTAADLVNLDSAVSGYKQALDADRTNEKLLLKYAKALDFKYRYLTGTAEEKKVRYEELSREFEKYGQTMGKTIEFNFVMALFWARRGDLTQNVLEAAKEGVADKIRSYAETVYNMDKTFEDYAACLILGRLHYKSPNIVFVLIWPDKNRSKQYLEEIYKALPDDTETKFFLADTCWELGNKDAAIKLYREVSGAAPRADHWYYDTMSIGECRDRIKELGIQ